MRLRARGFVTLGTTMAVGALLSSCAPELPPTSSPTPVVAPTPSATTPAESPQEREERLAYEGAEKAYRTFITEYFRVVGASYRPHVTQRDEARHADRTLPSKAYSDLHQAAAREASSIVGTIRGRLRRATSPMRPNRVMLTGVRRRLEAPRSSTGKGRSVGPRQS